MGNKYNKNNILVFFILVILLTILYHFYSINIKLLIRLILVSAITDLIIYILFIVLFVWHYLKYFNHETKIEYFFFNLDSSLNHFLTLVTLIVGTSSSKNIFRDIYIQCILKEKICFLNLNDYDISLLTIVTGFILYFCIKSGYKTFNGIFLNLENVLDKNRKEV